MVERVKNPKNRHKKRGLDKERTLVKRAKDRGLKYSFRSAGSHSPIDLIIIDPDKRSIELIQAKSTKGMGYWYIEPKLKEKLEKEHKPILDGVYDVEFKAL